MNKTITSSVTEFEYIVFYLNIQTKAVIYTIPNHVSRVSSSSVMTDSTDDNTATPTPGVACGMYPLDDKPFM